MIKKGVDVAGIQSELVLAYVIAQDLYRQYKTTCVMTSCKDGIHGRASLHYTGNAIDLRIWNLPGGKEKAPEVAKRLGELLGGQYDVVLEKDHIHVEFQPK